jgi:ATP-dependent RNA helicase DeaD
MIIDENHPFSSFGLSEPVLQAIARKGWTAPSSIQSIALPRLLADEGHCIVKARTGTGKTAAFGIPLIERLTQAGQSPRALILAPTRELALQVSREIASLVTGHYPRVTAVYGGASIRNQILDLRRGTEIVVGTPGRVMDLMERKALDVSAVDWFILDEADEMLDMGFFEDVEKILAAVKDAAAHAAEAGRQDSKSAGDRVSLHIALFSATMPEPILKVVRKHIGNAEIIVDAAPEDEKPLVDQYCILVRREDKLEALRRIIDSSDEFYGLIFCATKVETDELARRLVEAGYPAEAIHGDLSQEIRERTLRRFRLRQHGSRRHAAAAVSAGGEPAILVATDVAARGLDIENLSHVINWDLPNDRETYVHRIGRTARAGKRGIAISLAALSDRSRIHQISRTMEKTLGCGILWLKVPSVKAVMKALRRRISSTVVAALPEQGSVEADGEEPHADDAALTREVAGETAEGKETQAASPFLAKVCRNLIDRLGAEKAVEALVSLSYGEFLDPGRYGPITEFQEEDVHEPVRAAGKSAGGRSFGGKIAGRRRDDRMRRTSGSVSHAPAGKRGSGREFREETGDFTRVYVGQGRQHGLGARDIASLLMRAGGVPSRLVDEIEMKDYCSFATLPADAAKRACAFSRKDQQSPVIRPAKP